MRKQTPVVNIWADSDKQFTLCKCVYTYTTLNDSGILNYEIKDEWLVCFIGFLYQLNFETVTDLDKRFFQQNFNYLFFFIIDVSFGLSSFSLNQFLIFEQLYLFFIWIRWISIGCSSYKEIMINIYINYLNF